MLFHIKPLVQEERQSARAAAQQAVIRQVGEHPVRAHFDRYTASRYPPAVTRLITLLCIVLLLAAFTPSAIRLYVTGAPVQASAELIREHWNGRLKWVACVPSTRHSRLVPDSARRLGSALEPPYFEAVICARAYPEQKTMQNSYLQLQNIADAFHVSPHLPTGPVLLVDDIVDSGWSLTLVGWHLRECGVQRVYPFALAKAMGKSGV